MRYTEEDIKSCPHLMAKKVAKDSPFKEKITIGSESEIFTDKENQNLNNKKCPYNGVQKEKAKKTENEEDLSTDEDEP